MGDDAMVHPPVMRVTVIPVGAGAKDAKRVAVEPIAQKLLDLNKSRVIQWALSQRLNAKLAGLPSVLTSTQFPGVKLSYVKISGQEILEVTLYPEIPVETREEGRCLLILHDGNKITAVMMDRLVEEGNWVAAHAATLKQSTWGPDLIKVSQYKFDTQMGTILFSPVKVDGGVISKAEYHHICALRSDLRHFVASSTLAARTPRINGKEGRYFAPNDVFAIERTEQGQRLVRQSEGGNGAFPYAVSSEGVYYYAPMSVTSGGINVLQSALAGSLLSTDVFEQHATTQVKGFNPVPFTSSGHLVLDLTDEVMDRYEPLDVPTEGGTVSPGLLTVGHFPTDTTRYSGPRHGYFPSTELVVSDLDGYGFDDRDENYWGSTGYGQWVNDEYTVTRAYSTTVAALSGEITTPSPNYGMVIPITTFSQQDGLDVVTVTFSPVVATYSEVYVDEDNFSTSLTTSFLDWEFATTTNQSGTIGDQYTLATWGYPYNDWGHTRIPENPEGYAWLVSYPPGLGLSSGQYFASSNHVLQTPYGEVAFKEPLEWQNRYHQSLMMWKKYTPWLHLSNGKQMVQGWELFGERKVFYRPKPDGTPFEITQKLAAVAKTDIANIQAVLIDVPLKRIKEFT